VVVQNLSKEGTGDLVRALNKDLNDLTDLVDRSGSTVVVAPPTVHTNAVARPPPSVVHSSAQLDEVEDSAPN